MILSVDHTGARRSIGPHGGVRALLAGACMLSAWGQAQAQTTSVDIDLASGADPEQMEVRLRFNDAGFGEVFSGLVFTIRWPETSAVQLPLGTPFCVGAAFPIGASPAVVNGGYRYRTWNMEALAQLQADPDLDGGCGFVFPAGEWVTILTITPVNNTVCTEFQIVNDGFTGANNRDFYVSLNGQQYNADGGWLSGAIDEMPALAGPCVVDCHGVVGGSAYLDECGDCVGGTTGADPCEQDCAGTWGGPALPGTACDDNDPCTRDDSWNVECACVGAPVFSVVNVSGPDTVQVGEGVIYEVTEVDGATYAWDLPEGWATQDPGGSSVQVSVGGEAHQAVAVCVTLTVAGCEELVCTTVWVDAGLSVGDHTAPGAWVSVFPNPSNGVFQVTRSDAEGVQMEFTVHDLMGRQIGPAHTLNGALGLVLDLSKEANGTYLLRTLHQDEVQVMKLVVHH